MITTLLNILKTFCPGQVYLQGTIAENAAYPDEFITYWINYTEDNGHLDNTAVSVDWRGAVMFYSKTVANVFAIPAQIISSLQAAGFVISGKGNPLPCDEPTHTAWAFDFTYNEKL